MLKLRPAYLSFLFWLIILGCQDSEPKVLNLDIQNAKSWFDDHSEELDSSSTLMQSRRTKSSFRKSPEWEQSTVYELENGLKAVEVALNYDNNLIFSENSNLGQGAYNVMNTMLLLEMLAGQYAVYLVKIYPEDPATSLNVEDFSQLSFDNISASFSGSMMVFDWSENFLGGWKIVDGKKVNFYGRISNADQSNGRTASANSLDCYFLDTYWYSQACYGSNCAPPVQIDVTSVLVCDFVLEVAPITDDPNNTNGGQPVPNEGCYVEHPFIQGLTVPCEDYVSETEVGIDCASFQFVATNSTWQECSVLDVGFKVSIVALNGVVSTSTMKINRPIWFGFPITDYNGNTIAPGEAAEKAASAVQYANDLVSRLYIENPSTPLSMGQSWFMSFLKSKMLMDGGRADFYGSGSPLVSPSTASYLLFGNGNCY